MATFENPVVVGILVGVPSAVLGFLGYQRSKTADKNAHEQGAVGQIIAGLNSLVTQLSADNAELRTRIEAMEQKVTALEQALREERNGRP